MFHPAVFENSRADGFGVLEIDGTGNGPRFVPLKRTELHGRVAGPLAALSLRQTFGYTRKMCEETLAAAYRFPLPGDAAVQAVTVHFGNVEIRAGLQERQAAEAEYEEAQKTGRQAALATRESPDVFTLQVTGLRPDEDVLVETSFVQLARPEGAGWSLRIPLTTSPRYIRSDELTSRYAQGQPLALLRDPGHRFALDLLVEGAGSVRSATHRVLSEPIDGGLRVRLEQGEVTPDRDLLLFWTPVQEQARPRLDIRVHREGDRVYFLGLVTPPLQAESAPVARDIIILVDHSGSMEGPKWEAADWAVKRFLRSLTVQDSFALCLFHSTTRWFAREPRAADPEAVEEAVRFLEEHRDSGGTELGVALEQALRLRHEGPQRGDRSRQVLVITDAEVSDSPRILGLADDEYGRPDRRRISVLCIDAAPNSFLASELARRGGGSARFLTSSPDEDDITTALDEVLAEFAAPVATGLRLEVSRSVVESADHPPLASARDGWSGLDVGDLPAGRSAWVVGRFTITGDPEVGFRLVSGNREMTHRMVDVRKAESDLPGLKALFGVRRVNGLESLMQSGRVTEELQEGLRRLGYEPGRDFEIAQPGGQPVYAENARDTVTESLKPLLVREALEYGLASAETAFVAVREEAGKRIAGTVAVANALPAGWSDSFVGVAYCLAAPSASAITPARASTASGLLAGSIHRGPLARLFRMSKVDASVLADAAATSYSAAESVDISPGAGSACVSVGEPKTRAGEALLFDSTAQGGEKLPAGVTISRLSVRMLDASCRADAVDLQLALRIFVGDMVVPRAVVNLRDLLASGVRPLNLRRNKGEEVRIVLIDPNGAWRDSAPKIELTLAWQ